jgi:hypothetical protein
MAKRKKIRTKWKAERKVQLSKNRKQKAIRLSKEPQKVETAK